MKQTVAMVLLAFAFSSEVPAEELESPAPPEGFRWEQAAEVKGAFLVPDGWFWRVEAKQNTVGYFATRENIAEEGRFLAGLTINVFPKLKGRDAVSYATVFIEEFPKDKELLKSWDASMGPFVGAGCLTRDEVATMHTLMVANPATNTLYLFIFEAPNSQWYDVWSQYGQRMLKLMLIDDEV